MNRRTILPLALVLVVTGLLVWVEPTAAVLWPPVAALLVIAATRQALSGLLVGGIVGAILLANGNPVAALVSVFSDHLVPSLRSSWKQGAIAFTLILGGFAAVLEAGGGFATLLRKATRSSSNPGRRLESAAAGLGLLCFFDGLANGMVVGRVGRDLADRSGVARVKLAYIADSTSSAVACVAIISTWIAFQLSMIGEAYALAGREVNPYGVFVTSLPYNFYCWFTLVLMFVAIRLRFHPGPMAGFVNRAVATNDLSQDESSNLSRGQSSEGAVEAPVASALVPLGALLVSFFLFFLVLGSPRPILPLGRDKLVAAFGSDAGPLVLVLSGLLATAVAWAVYPAAGWSRFRPAARAFAGGVRTMLGPVFILLAAWILGSVLGDLGTAEQIAAFATAIASAALLPTAVFITAAAVSFTTGTSWGTMGLLFPLAIPAAVDLGTPETALPILVAAVFSGAVFGDHCSPFSDTTIVTSISCGVEPHDHVRTQIPYALLTAAVTVVLGFLPAGFGWPAPFLLTLGALTILLLPLAIRTLRGSSHPAKTE